MRIALFCLLLLYAYCQTIKCASGFTAYRTNGEDQYYVCTNVTDSARFKPSLPSGLTLIDGILKGTPKRVFDTTRIHIQNGDNYGNWFVTSHEYLSRIGTGFNSQVIFSNTPFTKFRCFPDSQCAHYIISPELPSGLVFDDTICEISGIYEGIDQTIDFTITAEDREYNATIPMSLIFKNTNAMTNGYSMCYYPFIERDSFYSDYYYQFMPVDACVQVSHPLNFTEKYHIEKVHYWPGIPDFYDKEFLMRLSGYLYISEKNIYTFHVRGTNAIRVTIDSNVIMEMGYAGCSYLQNNQNVTLSQGYHLLVIDYTHSDLDAHLSVKYKEVNAEEWIELDGDTLFYAGRSPSFLEYPVIHSLVNTDIQASFTKIHTGKATKFTITPSLPEGLSMNVSTGVISGSLTSPLSQDFTVTAEGLLGECSTSLHILIGEKPLEGLVGKYYAVDKAIDVCNHPVFYEYEMDLIVEQVETSLNFPFQPRKGFWPSVSSKVFKKSAYIEWSGLLLNDEEGEWGFFFSFYDGLKVYFDEELILDLFSCRGRKQEVLHRISLNEPKYHSLRILFFTNDDDFLFVMKVMKPSSTELVDVPKELLYHYPSQPFSMTTSRTHLIQGEEIRSIRPLFFAQSSFDHPIYTITPSLPDGLVMNDGVISGTPSSIFSLTSFQITAQSETAMIKKSLVTEIDLACYEAPVPQNITMVNSKGEPVNAIQTAIYEEMEEFVIACNDTNDCSISISPELPSGITFDSTTGKLSGRPLQSMNQGSFTITGTTEGGSITQTFTITIPTCQHGYYFYINTTGGKYDLMITQEGKEVVKEEGKTAGKYSSVFCIPKGTYQFSIRNATSSALQSCKCTREDSIVFFDVTLSEPSYSTSLYTVISSKPQLLFNVQTLYLLPAEKFKLFFSIEGLYRPLRINPALPQDLYLNEFEKSFGGQIFKTGRFTFTITCENEVGSAEVELELFVGFCPESYRMLHGKKGVSTDGDRITLRRQSDDQLVIDRDLGFDSSDQFIFCLQPIPYIVTLYTKSNNNDFYDPQYYYHQSIVNSRMSELGGKKYPRHLLLRDENHTVVGSFVLDEQQEEEYLFTPFMLFNEEQGRKVWLSSKKVGSQWNQFDFSDKKWMEMKPSDALFFSPAIQTAYFRYMVYMKEEEYVGAVTVLVKAHGGFVLYVNGEEAIRINVPAGTLSNTAFASEIVNLREWYRISLNPNLFHEDLNLIAVELHAYNHANEAESIYFDMKSYQYTSRTIFLSAEEDGTPTGSTNAPDPSSKVENAFFDINDNTYWGDNALPAWLRFTFHNQQFEYVNKVVIRSGNREGFDPTQFTIFGVRNQTVLRDDSYVVEEVKESLKVVNNFYFFNNQTQEEVTLYLEGQVPYQAYEFLFYRGASKSSTSVHVNNIRLYSERRVWCEGEGRWSETPGNTMVYGKCGMFDIGETTRYCQEVNYKGVWSDIQKDTCLTTWATKTTAFVDLQYRIVNCTMSLWKSAVEQAFKETLVREVTVKEEEVLFFLPKQCSEEGEIPVLCVRTRLQPHRLASEYVKMELNLFNENATALFYKKQPANPIPVDIEIYPEGKIRIHQFWSGKETVYVVTIAVMMVLYVVLFTLYCKNVRVGRNSTRKRLPKMSANTPLLKV